MTTLTQPVLTSNSHSLSVEIVDVTPVLAEEWLGKNINNRNRKERKINQFARDMRAGNWRMTAEPIKFAWDGRLLDGQNRLTAVVKSGRTVRMMVVRGLSHEAQDVMDTGTARTAGDSLVIHGYPNATALAAAAKLLVLWETDRFYVDNKDQQVTHAEIQDFIHGNELIAFATNTGVNLRKDIQAPPSAIAAAFYLTARIDMEAAQEFFGRVADGIELSAGNPILALRSRLQKIRNEKTKVSPIAHVSLIIRTWNAYRSGRKMASIPVFNGTGPIRCPQPK